METYHTHFNGADIFKVTIKNNKVQIYDRIDNDNDNNSDNDSDNDSNYIYDKPIKYSKKPCLIYYCSNVFIGDNDLSIGTDDRFPKPCYECKGNSILIQVAGEKSKYIFIGDEVYEFDVFESGKIVEFVSMMGYSQVPYPFAVCENGDCYLLTDYVKIKRCQEVNKLLKVYKGSYHDVYYENQKSNFIEKFNKNILYRGD